jgi:hypothetical protein
LIPKRFRDRNAWDVFARRDAAALLSPGLARRFPFFAPLWTRREVSLRFRGLANGEIAK